MTRMVTEMESLAGTTGLAAAKMGSLLLLPLCRLPVTGRVYRVEPVHYLPSTKRHLSPLIAFSSRGI